MIESNTPEKEVSSGFDSSDFNNYRYTFNAPNRYIDSFGYASNEYSMIVDPGKKQVIVYRGYFLQSGGQSNAVVIQNAKTFNQTLKLGLHLADEFFVTASRITWL